MKKALFLLTLVVFSNHYSVQAQRENANWRFGTQAGVVFPVSGGPTAVGGSALIGREACSVASDPAGNVLCYTNAVQVWDRNNTPMPNGTLFRSNTSASQGALLLPNPANPQQQYLFTVDSAEDNLAGGLCYSIVDMTLRGGLGDIGAVKEVQVVVPGNVAVAEKLTAVRHTNGRDFWILVHGWNSNAFYSYLLTPTGLSMVPVVSNAGSVHSGGSGANLNGNCVGYMRASADGLKLAVAIREVTVEVFSFNPSTGQVGGFRPVSISVRYQYGLEFSPDGNKLYVSDLIGNSIRQIDLTSPVLTAQLVQQLSNATGAILRGLDDVLYVTVELSNYLAAITNPNGTAATCGLVANGAFLGAGQGRQGLPNFPNAYARALTFNTSLFACVGGTVQVSTSPSAQPTSTAFAWNFGDPTAGSSNITTGAIATHTYASAGSYTITLTATSASGTLISQRTVTVSAGPVFSLGARVQSICPRQAVTLGSTTALPAGSTYRWQDGTTAPTLNVSISGLYRLVVTSSQGCRARDSVTVQFNARPIVELGNDTILCDDFKKVVLQANPQPTGSTYRWQDGSTAATYLAQATGLYWLEVRNTSGCTARDTVLVGSLVCRPVKIPNIITPNNDIVNQAFVLQGLSAADWAIGIYNRWGREIYKRESYDNTWDAQGQADGLYYYLLTNSRTGQKYQGWVEVLR